ncbi:MAG: hypothetical protein IKK24_05575 [Clostridia bacterium]|nr:hypothetical protein [Clostridia bacterium]
MKEFTLMYMFNLALNRIWALLLAAFFFAAAAFCFCEFLATPAYNATASVLVTNGGIIVKDNYDASESVNTTDITASISLVDTITDILETSDIFKQLAEETNGAYSYSELKQMATVSRRTDNSMFVDVSFKAESSKEATELVNAFVALAPDYITNFVPYSNVAVASTADKAVMVFPRTALTVVIVGVLGAVLAFGVVLLIDTLDQAISGDEDFTTHYDIPLIGTVPDFESIGIIGANSNYQKGGYKSGY